ncbi:MAG TPA: hypothetical protein VF223_04810, partial [Trebonia sp.]
TANARPGAAVDLAGLDLGRMPKPVMAELVTRARALQPEQLRAEVARWRTIVVQRRTTTADLLSEVDQLLDSGASARTLATRIEGTIRRAGMDGAAKDWPDAAEAQKILTAARTGDPAKVRRAVAAAEKKLGLQRVGEQAGAVVRYDKAAMDPIGGAKIPADAHVVVVRPGYRMADGTVLSRPVVEEATAQEVRAVGLAPRLAEPPYDERYAQLGQSSVLRRTDTRPMGGGEARVDQWTMADGQQIVYKDYGAKGIMTAADARRAVDAETLAARVADAVGLPSAAARQAGEKSLYMEFIEGPSGATRVPWGGQIPADILESDDGKLMGLLDMLIGERDRHADNWIIRASDGRLVPIDMGSAFLPGTGPGNIASRFAENLFVTNDPVRLFPTWKATNDLSKADLAIIRGRLEALKPEFVAAGHLPWYNAMMVRLREIEKRASGTGTIL